MKAFLTVVFLALAVTARAEWTLSFRKVVATLPGGAEFVAREAQQDGAAVRVQGVFFTAKQARFAVIDNPGRLSLGEVLPSLPALAGTNGAYFHADGTPVGLQISAGAKVHPYETAKLLSGVFVVTKGVPRLVRSARYTPSKYDGEALQCGPFLVENGKAIAGLNAVKSARRTVVATDGNGKWALLIFSYATLAETAGILASGTIFPDFPVKQALNLDGGSSTGLWVATVPKPFYLSEFGRVRNFLGILPR
jgi:exopolysaccharide biosynthesis protein